ncbi:unnamed protein product [Rhizophagus irregularis]|nr:unnamed protein product [Rhizophagus irregularis]
MLNNEYDVQTSYIMMSGHQLFVNVSLRIWMSNIMFTDSFTMNEKSHQKLDSEQDLKQILPFHPEHNHILNREMTVRMNPDRNLNSSYGRNKQTISIIDSQPNFDNNFTQQTESWILYNVTNSRQRVPQLIPKGLVVMEIHFVG